MTKKKNNKLYDRVNIEKNRILNNRSSWKYLVRVIDTACMRYSILYDQE